MIIRVPDYHYWFVLMLNKNKYHSLMTCHNLISKRPSKLYFTPSESENGFVISPRPDFVIRFVQLQSLQRRLFSTWKCFQKDNFGCLKKEVSARSRNLLKRHGQGSLHQVNSKVALSVYPIWVCFQWTSFVPLKIHPRLCLYLSHRSTKLPNNHQKT